MNLKKQFISLHLYNFLFSLRITDAVWVVFLLDRGFSLAQVGIAEGVFHLVSFVSVSYTHLTLPTICSV